jgi:uncharacterized membrane protein
LADRFIVPNLHVILIHYPIALLFLGTAIEVLSFLWRRSGLRSAGRWMILLGALSMLPAAASGMFAFSSLIDQGTLSDIQYHLLKDHGIWQGVAAVLSAVVVVLWLGCSEKWRKKLYWPSLILLVLAVVMSISAAWDGGEAVFRHGTGVVEATTQPASRGLSYYFDPLEWHLIFAGFMAAFALGALGTAYRRIARGNELRRLPSDTDETPVSATRFWLVAVVFALLTATVGLWYLSVSTEAWSVAMNKVAPHGNVFDRVHAFLRTLLFDSKVGIFGEKLRTGDINYPRRAYHVGNGVFLIVVTILLAAHARWRPRKTIMLTLLAILLILSLAAQVWLGSLMLFEGPQGSVTGWMAGN